MPRYVVPLTTYANCAVEVETDSEDPAEITRLAEEQVYVRLCNHCSSSGNESLEVGDEWAAVEYDGEHQFTRID